MFHNSAFILLWSHLIVVKEFEYTMVDFFEYDLLNILICKFMLLFLSYLRNVIFFIPIILIIEIEFIVIL